MLINASVLQRLPIGSMRDGGRVGMVANLVLNPNNLHIDGFICRIGGHTDQVIFHSDIRDLTPFGIVIDDRDRLISASDAVRLKPIMEMKFSFTGLAAYVEGKKIGTVSDYSVDNGSLFVQKIYVKPSLINRWKAAQFIFGRQQIKEVTPHRVIFADSSAVKARHVRLEKPLKETAHPSLSTSATKE